MKQFIIKCTFFLGLVILINILYLIILVCFSPGFKKVYDISKIENKKYDLLVLGNSMALDGIDAEYLTSNNIKTYNFSVAGNHISTSLMILENYLKHNQKPKTVMLCLSSSIGNSYLNKIPFSNPEVDFFFKPSLKKNIVNPPLFNFQWLAIDLIKIIISKDHRNAKLVLGQWQTNKVIPDNSVYKQMDIKFLDYKNPYLNKIVDLCQKNAIKVLLVELPGSNKNRDQIPFYNKIPLLNNKKHLLYNLNNYSLSSEILDPKTDWLSPDHLNQSGAKKITKFLFEKEIFKSN